MASTPSFPTASGTVTIDDDALVVRRSPRRFLRSQVVRVRDGRLVHRFGAAVSIASIVLVPLFVFEATVDLLGATSVVEALIAGCIIAAWLGVAVTVTVFDRRVPLERLRRGITAHGRYGIELPSDAVPRWGPVRLAGFPWVMFVRPDDRDAMLEELASRDVPVEQSFVASDATYRFFRAGGGYFCPRCDQRVSPRSAACSSCGQPLYSERPTPSSTDDDAVGRPS